MQHNLRRTHALCVYYRGGERSFEAFDSFEVGSSVCLEKRKVVREVCYGVVEGCLEVGRGSRDKGEE